MTPTLQDVQAAIAAMDEQRAVLNAMRNFTPDQSSIQCDRIHGLRRDAADLALQYCRAGGWRPIADGLPDRPDGMGQDAFLAVHPDGHIYLATQHPDWWNHEDKRRRVFDGERVTHWQPLPQAPRSDV